MICGIYLIACTSSGRKYVGQSVDVERRWWQHKNQAKKGRHSNPIIQASWNKHGEESFTFDLIEECTREDLGSREQHWIDTLKTSYKFGGMNLEEEIEIGYSQRIPSPQQIENRVKTVSKLVEAFGEKKFVRDWCLEYNQVPSTVHWRLRNGWSAEKAISTPSQKQLIEYQGECKSLSEHARDFNQNPERVRERINRGWSIEEALKTSKLR